MCARVFQRGGGRRTHTHRAHAQDAQKISKERWKRCLWRAGWGYGQSNVRTLILSSSSLEKEGISLKRLEKASLSCTIPPLGALAFQISTLATLSPQAHRCLEFSRRLLCGPPQVGSLPTGAGESPQNTGLSRRSAPCQAAVRPWILSKQSGGAAHQGPQTPRPTHIHGQGHVQGRAAYLAERLHLLQDPVDLWHDILAIHQNGCV